MALGSPLRAPGPAETDPEFPYRDDRPDIEPVSASLLILRAPEPELLDEPDDLPELADLPGLADFPEPEEVALLPCVPPALRAELPPVLQSFGRLRDSRPMPRSGTRLPELPSFRNMTRLPLSCWTEIRVPDGRTLGA